ncbi:MAG: exodeoxyribonuclease VII large subunit [Candidatus Saccharimonadales bacterium]
MAGEQQLVFGVSDFVAVVNQTFEYAFTGVYIEGEISDLRVSKNKWVYFDLKDDSASIRCFATVFQAGGAFEDGMRVRVRVMPKLHNQYGFSVTVQSIQPVGEGALKRASDLLRMKLEKEGLFDPGRKRELPYPPQTIALVASRESAAYGDFVKVINARWRGMRIDSYDVQVQGEAAPESLVQAINRASQSDAEVLVVTRGGGSLDDLAAFSDERVVRAVAASRIPTLVAIGHERDESLAELAADVRASTPSNAAELLTPDYRDAQARLQTTKAQLGQLLLQSVTNKQSALAEQHHLLRAGVERNFVRYAHELTGRQQLLSLLNPKSVMARGYNLAFKQAKLVRSSKELREGDTLELHFVDGNAQVIVQKMYSGNE